MDKQRHENRSHKQRRYVLNNILRREIRSKSLRKFWRKHKWIDIYLLSFLDKHYCFAVTPHNQWEQAYMFFLGIASERYDLEGYLLKKQEKEEWHS